jgi:hypothetical protein
MEAYFFTKIPSHRLSAQKRKYGEENQVFFSFSKSEFYDFAVAQNTIFV